MRRRRKQGVGQVYAVSAKVLIAVAQVLAPIISLSARHDLR
jgi:hypothetical protein